MATYDQNGGDCGQWIVLALAHGTLATHPDSAEPEQAGHRQKARAWYDQAVKQIDGHPGLKDEVGQAIRAFRAEAAGAVTLAEVLTNSAIQIPVAVLLNRSAAQRIDLVPANTPSNAAYARLPDFLTMKGTLGNPKADGGGCARAVAGNH